LYYYKSSLWNTHDLDFSAAATDTSYEPALLLQMKNLENRSGEYMCITIHQVFGAKMTISQVFGAKMTISQVFGAKRLELDRPLHFSRACTYPIGRSLCTWCLVDQAPRKENSTNAKLIVGKPPFSRGFLVGWFGLKSMQRVLACPSCRLLYR